MNGDHMFEDTLVCSVNVTVKKHNNQNVIIKEGFMLEEVYVFDQILTY